MICCWEFPLCGVTICIVSIENRTQKRISTTDSLYLLYLEETVVSILKLRTVTFIWMKLEYAALVELNWQEKTGVLVDKPKQVPLCPPQIPHKLPWNRSRNSAVKKRRTYLSFTYRYCALSLLGSSDWSDIEPKYYFHNNQADSDGEHRNIKRKREVWYHF